MSKAVFLDRDGVLNPLVYNPITSEYESPHYPEDFSIYPNVVKALKKLDSLGYTLFVVSNQPSYAKGKTTLENIKAIGELLADYLKENNVDIKEYYYCYHHPDGDVENYSKKCECRKPGTFFLEQAIKKYKLDPKECWFIGDRDTDITCGKAMGMHTILIKNEHSKEKTGKEKPSEYASNIYEAVIKIMGGNKG